MGSCQSSSSSAAFVSSAKSSGRMEEDEASRSPAAPQPKRKGRETYQCKVCGETFTRAWALVQHLWIHTGDEPFRCDRCSCSFSALESLHQHQREEHNVHVTKPTSIDEDEVKCGHCGKRYKGRGTLRKHIRRKHIKLRPTGAFHCDLCGNVYSSGGDLLKHKEEKHQGIKPEEEESALVVNGASESPDGGSKTESNSPEEECELCGETFPNMTRLRIHRRLHDGKRVHACRHCGAEFEFESHLANHERSHTGERPFGCDLCDDRFSVASTLYAHKRTVHNQTLAFYKCGECGATFPNQKQLVFHQIRCREAQDGEEEESVEAPKDEEAPVFSCTKCGKGFASDLQLLVHEREHISNCKRCGKVFSSEHSLKVHEKTHKDKCPYSCLHCGGSFTSLQALHIHQFHLHPDEKAAPSDQPKPKPYKCEYCGRAFRSKHHLQEHRYIHIGRPFVCRVCGSRFNREIQLRRHREGKCGTSLVRCGCCGEKFMSRGQLLFHRRRVHGTKKPRDGSDDEGREKHDCDRCEENFTDPSSFVLHKCSVQSSEKTLKCKDCGAAVKAKVRDTTLSNVFAVTSLSDVKCFLKNHTLH